MSITGPTDFTAQIANSTAEPDVTWSITGGGTVSAMTGLHVTVTPPPGKTSEILTATADGKTATVQIVSVPATLTSEEIPGLSANVTVQYDAEDIPHINCAQANDCFAVQGYLQARDRFFEMDFLRHVGGSTLSELIGIAGLSQDVELRTLFITRAGHPLAADLVASMDPTTAATVNAFVGGINAYLNQLKADPHAALPGEYAQLPFPLTAADIPAWTAQDTFALARLQQFQLSETIEDESTWGELAAAWSSGPLKDLGKLNAYIRAAAPPTEQAHTLAPTSLDGLVAAKAAPLPSNSIGKWANALAAAEAKFSTLRDHLRPLNATVGSNNWVVAAVKSATGVSMVANDPHLGLQYPPLFHLSVMTSANAADNLNLAGGAFPGIPGGLVGRGAHVGWGVTVVGYDVTDLYMEQFLPQGSCLTAAPCVLFKGVPTAVIPVPETYHVRVGAGSAGLVDAQTLPAAERPPTAVIVVPQHGPVIQAPDATGIAISARWTGQEGNTNDLKAILGLNTATDVDAAIAALTNFSTGAQNFVLADDAGHIAYDPHALVPVRNFADARVVGANVKPPWFPLAGDGTAEWGDGTSNCAAATATPVPASCWIDNTLLPQGKDPAKGYFFTANSDPTATGVSDDNNPLGHPPYFSFDWDDSSGLRATRIDQLLSAAIEANGTVSLTDMEAIQSDHVSRLGKIFGDIIAALPTTANDPADLVGARAVLAQWATNGYDCPSGLTGSDPKLSPIDPTPAVVQNSSGCYLFHEFLRVLITNVFTDDLAAAKQGVNGLWALKAMIYMLSLPANDPGASFCNNVSATGTLVSAQSCSEQVVTALVTAFDTLSAQVDPMPANWVWGRVHTIQPVSLLALVTNNYEPGPYARPGGAFTVDVGTPSLSAGSVKSFNYTSGGNVRHISLMDPANPVVKMQLPGPERDGPTTVVGPNLLGQWVANQYFDFAFGSQISAAVVSSQTFFGSSGGGGSGTGGD